MSDTNTYIEPDINTVVVSSGTPTETTTLPLESKDPSFVATESKDLSSLPSVSLKKRPQKDQPIIAERTKRLPFSLKPSRTAPRDDYSKYASVRRRKSFSSSSSTKRIDSLQLQEFLKKDNHGDFLDKFYSSDTKEDEDEASGSEKNNERKDQEILEAVSEMENLQTWPPLEEDADLASEKTDIQEVDSDNNNLESGKQEDQVVSVAPSELSSPSKVSLELTSSGSLKAEEEMINEMQPDFLEKIKNNGLFEGSFNEEVLDCHIDEELTINRQLGSSPVFNTLLPMISQNNTSLSSSPTQNLTITPSPKQNLTITPSLTCADEISEEREAPSIMPSSIQYLPSTSSLMLRSSLFIPDDFSLEYTNPNLKAFFNESPSDSSRQSLTTPPWSLSSYVTSYYNERYSQCSCLLRPYLPTNNIIQTEIQKIIRTKHSLIDLGKILALLVLLKWMRRKYPALTTLFVDSFILSQFYLRFIQK